MDIIIPLASGRQKSKTDTELKAAIRSLKNFSHGKIFIVSEELPDWLDAHLIQAPDGERKAQTIKHKILAACEDSRVSDDFLFMSDDHYILKPVTNIQFYCSGTLRDWANRHVSEGYKSYIKNTINALKGKPQIYFNVHTPIVYNKEKFSECMSLYNWERYDFIIKSLYCNHYGLEGTEIQDPKAPQRMTYQEIKEFTKDKTFLSSPKILTQAMERFLNDTFPEPSRYELLTIEK